MAGHALDNPGVEDDDYRYIAHCIPVKTAGNHGCQLSVGFGIAYQL